jgi:hypothetical protein
MKSFITFCTVILIFFSLQSNAQGILGPNHLRVNEIGHYTAVNIPGGGKWDLSNFSPCQAFFVGGDPLERDVNAGPTPGVFNLVCDGGEPFIAYLNVFVEDILPVDLSAFVSIVIDGNVLLKWTTASETNNSGFDMERLNEKGQTSDDWTKISFVRGHGTNSLPNNYEFTDRNLPSGKYNYRLKQIDFNGNFEYHNLSDEVVIGVPEKFELSQNYPNPFNPSTVISYSLSENSFVTLKVYDVIGNEVATLVSEKQNSGIYNYQFSTVNYQLSSGVYFYKIEAGSFSAVKRMIMIK